MKKNFFAPCSTAILALSLSVTAVPAFAQGFGPPIMDITGHWANRQHEDQYGRTQGEELGDYTGTPLNEAARQRADLWDAALYGLDEWQCRPHTSPNIWRSVYPAHISKDVEPVTGETIAYHINFQNLIDRVIWMDGRPRPRRTPCTPGPVSPPASGTATSSPSRRRISRSTSSKGTACRTATGRRWSSTSSVTAIS
jgi:hypothetical protein